MIWLQIFAGYWAIGLLVFLWGFVWCDEGDWLIEQNRQLGRETIRREPRPAEEFFTLFVAAGVMSLLWPAAFIDLDDDDDDDDGHWEEEKEIVLVRAQ